MGSQAGNGGLYGAEITTGRAGKARVPLRTFIEPAREVPVMHKTDVLVVGGGPAGTTAAIAAARLGARVMLVERYNHLGGLSTGGLVIWIDRMTDWDGKLVIRGLGRELLDRLPKDAIYGPNPGIWGTKAPDEVAKWRPRFSAHHDTVTWAPMIDPEQLKAVSLQAAREAGVELIFHAWASNAIIEGGRVSGVIFESKQGRFGISATVVVDTTGDGDIFAAAGEDSSNDVDASNIHQCINTSWLWGGVDIARWLAFRTTAEFDAFSKAGRSEIGLFEMPVPTWRNDVAVFMGPRFAGYNAIDVQDLTEVELRSRDKMMELAKICRLQRNRRSRSDRSRAPVARQDDGTARLLSQACARLRVRVDHSYGSANRCASKSSFDRAGFIDARSLAGRCRPRRRNWYQSKPCTEVPERIGSLFESPSAQHSWARGRWASYVDGCIVAYLHA